MGMVMTRPMATRTSVGRSNVRQQRNGNDLPCLPHAIFACRTPSGSTCVDFSAIDGGCDILMTGCARVTCPSSIGWFRDDDDCDVLACVGNI